MVTKAAQACANSVTDEELNKGMLYPDVNRLREVSLNVAVATANQAIEEGLSNTPKEGLEERGHQSAWQPAYPIIEPE